MGASSIYKKFRGISDRTLSYALQSHAGGLNSLMQWAVVVEKERKQLRIVLAVAAVWLVGLTIWMGIR